MYSQSTDLGLETPIIAPLFLGLDCLVSTTSDKQRVKTHKGGWGWGALFLELMRMERAVTLLHSQENAQTLLTLSFRSIFLVGKTPTHASSPPITWVMAGTSHSGVLRGNSETSQYFPSLHSQSFTFPQTTPPCTHRSNLSSTTTILV